MIRQTGDVEKKEGDARKREVSATAGVRKGVGKKSRKKEREKGERKRREKGEEKERDRYQEEGG